MTDSEERSVPAGVIEIDGALLARLQGVLDERNLGSASRFTAQLIVDFLRRIAATGFDRDELTGAATRHDFMHRLKLQFSSGQRQPSAETLGCFRADLASAAPLDRDAGLRSYSQALERAHGTESVVRWGATEFVVWPFRKVDSDETRTYTELTIERKQAASANLLVDWLALCIQTAVNEAVPRGHSLRANQPRALLRG